MTTLPMIYKFSLLAIMLSISTTSFSQAISLSILTSAGDFSTNQEGLSLDWTLGEVFSETVQHTYDCTGGFQQGIKTVDQIPTVDVVQNEKKSVPNYPDFNREEINVLVYPNPSSDLLKLKFPEPISENLLVNIFDENGKEVLVRKFSPSSNSTFFSLQIDQLRPGVYFLQLAHSTKSLLTQSFVKI